MFSTKIQRHVKDKMQKKWRPFHATDFQSLMYPCFTFCRILGIFPYKINFDLRASTFKISKPHYILSTVIICAYCLFYVLLIRDIILSKIDTFGDVTSNLDAICYFTFNSLIAIITYILSNPQMRLLQTIWKISSELSSVSYQNLSRLIHGKDILGTVVIIMQGYIYFLKVKVFEMSCWNVVKTTFIMYSVLLEFHVNMLYTNCVCILKACFKKINDDLIHMQRFMINDMKPYVPYSLISHMQKNQIFLIKLKILMRQHLTISKTVQMLNIIFSLQLLATVIISFTQITFKLYFYAVHWQGDILISFNKQFVHILLTIIIHYTVKIMLLVWACETGKNQAQEIGTTISDVLNNTRDKQIKDELQLFRLQIQHRKTTFFVKGVGLAVDVTLLTSMVGGIATYMLILIQFLIISHSCDEKFVSNFT